MGASFFVALEKIQQTLANREETEGSSGKKNRANKRLLGQRRERARLEAADFCDDFIERLPFRVDFPTQKAKAPQVIESNFTQLLGGVPEQNGAAKGPRRSDGVRSTPVLPHAESTEELPKKPRSHCGPLCPWREVLRS